MCLEFGVKNFCVIFWNFEVKIFGVFWGHIPRKFRYTYYFGTHGKSKNEFLEDLWSQNASQIYLRMIIYQFWKIFKKVKKNFFSKFLRRCILCPFWRFFGVRAPNRMREVQKCGLRLWRSYFRYNVGTYRVFASQKGAWSYLL